MRHRKYRGNRNIYNWESLHRDLIGTLDKLNGNTILKVKTFRANDGSYAKYLVTASNNKKLMMITALWKGKVQWRFCTTCEEKRRPKESSDKYQRLIKVHYCRKCRTELEKI